MSHRFIHPKYIAKTFIIAVMSLVLLTQSTVQAQSATMANNELKSLTSKINTEIDRRLNETEKASESLNEINAVPQSAKSSVSTALKDSEKSLKDYKTELANAKDPAAAKALGDKVDKQYDKYASANATAKTLKDGDAQQQSFKSLESLSKDAQTSIDKAGASGEDVSGPQELLKTLTQLIQSIGAIIASIVALILSLASGNFTEALEIFQAIIGQLAQNIVSIETAQNGMISIVAQLGNIDAAK